MVVVVVVAVAVAVVVVVSSSSRSRSGSRSSSSSSSCCRSSRISHGCWEGVLEGLLQDGMGTLTNWQEFT